MNLLWDLVVGSLLWVAIIAGLISIVRDCMKDRHLESTFLDREEQGCQHCCGLGNLEILPHQRQEP